MLSKLFTVGYFLQSECKVNKAIVDIRLRQHCAIPAPPSRPIGRIACALRFSECDLRLPSILNDPFCSVRRSNAAATAAAKIANAFKWPEQTPENCSFLLGDRVPI